jgi:hypothetical protein
MGSQLAVIAKQARWIRLLLLRRLCNFNPEENLIISASPRGGSTWMSELINLIPKTAVLAEPLYRRLVSPFNALHFGWNQYIPEDAEWNEAKKVFEEVFRGRLLTGWSSPPYSLLTADRLIIKFCHAHALLPWLTRNFNFKHAPIFLIRHPFAVVASQLKCIGWKPDFPGYRIPDCPFNEYYLAHEEFLLGIRTQEEALVATWCLTNLVQLRNARNDKNWITVYYEHLLANPQREIHRIFDRWRLPIPDDIFSRVGKPSEKTMEASFEQGKAKQLAKWKSFFNEGQLKKMMAVLDHFGVEQYGMDVFPKIATDSGIRTGNSDTASITGTGT